MDLAGKLSADICRHVATTPYSALSAEVLHATKRALLDATGVMLAASGLSREVQPFIALAKSGGPGVCTILGTGLAASATMAALANGAMAHALDFEDAFDPAPSHPNASMIPAAIAMAQAHGPVDGQNFVTALAIGCDLVCRMGLSLRQTMEEGGWYPPPILGAFGAAAATARIAGLCPDQTRDALSLTLCQATMPGEIKHSQDTIIRAVREAFPAQAAVISALLARDGVTGFEAPLEGKDGFFRLYAGGHFDEGTLINGLGESFQGERLSFKPWPACRGTHAYIEIIFDLVQKYAIDWRDVEKVTVKTGEVQRMLVEPKERKQVPSTAIDAKFSIPFTTALALVRGKVSLDDFADDALVDADILAVARLVEAVENPDWGREKASAGALTLHMKNGRELQGEVEVARGHPDRPLSTDALIEKFVDCAARAAQPMQRCHALEYAQALLNIDQANDVGAIFATFQSQ